MQAGSAARRVTAVAAIARDIGRRIPQSLTARTACRIGDNRRIVRVRRGVVDIDRGDTAKGCAAIPSVQAFPAIPANTAGIDDVDRIVEIVLIDVDGGIATGSGAAIATDIIRFAGRETKDVAAISTGSDRGYRKLGEAQRAGIVVEGRVAAGCVATVATDTGLHRVAQTIERTAAVATTSAIGAGTDDDVAGIDRRTTIEVEDCCAADAITAGAGIGTVAIAATSGGPIRGNDLVVAFSGYGQGVGDGQIARLGIECGIAADTATTVSAGRTISCIAIRSITAEAIGGDCQIGDGCVTAIQVEDHIAALSVSAITGRCSAGKRRGCYRQIFGKRQWSYHRCGTGTWKRQQIATTTARSARTDRYVGGGEDTAQQIECYIAAKA